MTNLTDLARRVSELQGPDRLLDANIHWRVRRDDFEADDDHTDETYCYARHGWTMNRADHAFLDSVPVPRYTASLDAAMTLVPEGWRPVIDFAEGETVQVDLWHNEVKCDDLPYQERTKAVAVTGPLALTAAALIARSEA